jgi:hypothetical protein
MLQLLLMLQLPLILDVAVVLLLRSTSQPFSVGLGFARDEPGGPAGIFDVHAELVVVPEVPVSVRPYPHRVRNFADAENAA